MTHSRAERFLQEAWHSQVTITKTSTSPLIRLVSRAANGSGVSQYESLMISSKPDMSLAPKTTVSSAGYGILNVELTVQCKVCLDVGQRRHYPSDHLYNEGQSAWLL